MINFIIQFNPILKNNRPYSNLVITIIILSKVWNQWILKTVLIIELCNTMRTLKPKKKIQLGSKIQWIAKRIIYKNLNLSNLVQTNRSRIKIQHIINFQCKWINYNKNRINTQSITSMVFPFLISHLILRISAKILYLILKLNNY